MDQPPSAGRFPILGGVTEIVLASGSPRRRELLARLGLDYAVRAADVDEASQPSERPTALALRLAGTKARAVAGEIVVAADTVVARGRALYGKPDDPDDAARMLRELAGRHHRVITGVAVRSRSGLVSRAATTRVLLRPLSDEEIEAYVASGDPLDKAGAYAIQNERVRPVAQVRGCTCNVVGFPLGVVAELLREAGVDLPVGPADGCPYRRFTPERCCLQP
jgi:septum formation protein